MAPAPIKAAYLQCMFPWRMFSIEAAPTLNREAIMEMATTCWALMPGMRKRAGTVMIPHPTPVEAWRVPTTRPSTTKPTA